ncbi:MAG TPA: transporter substrate-binding domain-containing protein [Coriobacteriia bacterium]
MKRRVFAVLSAVAVALAVTGCTGVITTPTLTPKIAPPLIGTAGVLKVAVDLSYPPFAGTVKGQNVGLDIDVAAAVAEQLGLKLEIVDADPSAAMGLVKDGSVDMILGGLTVESAVASQVAFAGTYISDAPAVFAATGTSVSVDALGTKRVAVQTGSLAYWLLLGKYGDAPLMQVASLDEALSAVDSGTADVAAGDALVGAYLLRDHSELQYEGQLGSAFPLGAGVSQSKPDLETQIRAALDKLASQGVLETIRHKWIGELPPLRVIDTSGSEDPSSTVETSATP